MKLASRRQNGQRRPQSFPLSQKMLLHLSISGGGFESGLEQQLPHSTRREQIVTTLFAVLRRAVDHTWITKEKECPLGDQGRQVPGCVNLKLKEISDETIEVRVQQQAHE